MTNPLHEESPTLLVREIVVKPVPFITVAVRQEFDSLRLFVRVPARRPRGDRQAARERDGRTKRVRRESGAAKAAGAGATGVEHCRQSPSSE